jgi:hypothetical protein
MDFEKFTMAGAGSPESGSKRVHKKVYLPRWMVHL